MNIPILQFNSGEMTPRCDARSDVEKYQGGCRHLENFIAQIYGCVERRPGTYYIYNATTSPTGATNTVVRKIPFIYSASIAYTVELGNKYARFFYNGAVLDDDGDVWISTPYETAYLFELKIKQIADVLWITHPRYPPSKLSRTAVKTFVLEEIDFRKGPFLTRNDIVDPANPSTTTLSTSVTQAGGSGELYASASIFLQGHKGALFKLIHPKAAIEITQSGAGTSSALKVKGTAHFKTTGTWAGTVHLQRNENEGDWEYFRTYTGLTSGARNDSLAFAEEEENVYYRIYAVGAGMTGFGATLSIDKGVTEGIVKVKSVINPYRCSIEVYSAIESTAVTKKWCEGAWSQSRGYPGAITFSGNRCVYAGASRALDDDEFSASEYPSLKI